ncbi:TorD/DmsD family molecular chaperone [Endozoicomonas euniceicola]|uniref:Molecular chaperone TorD family protein n=1 Tax=Endozoicomonas euniceicola TaxID=1234143 RepID=A0ABY6GSX4_9GAMM|nr:molecular chaperone TorD family protein [Endozoicomonas euniceicola]UYM15166.1 molecular chaperone TorD family protein [Endozoicomonas euniceicola]
MSNETPTILADFQFSCQLIYQCLHKTPDVEFLEQLKQLAEHGQDSTSHHEINDGLTLIAKGLQPSVPETSRDIKADYAELFLGPDELKAAPWASVYLTEEQTLCGEPTLAAKQFYRDCGVEIDTGTREPEDHLGLMFAFMADRLAKMVETEPDSACLDTQRDVLKDFLTEHVLTWAPRFLAVMYDNAQTDVYRGISQLIKGSLEQLAALTGAEYRIVRLYR